MNGKRPAEDNISEQKRTRMKLISPNDISSESDTESIHSCQGYKTELANDTNDTSSSSVAEAYHAEYEIAEPEKEKLKFYFSDDSFEEDDNIPVKVLKVTSSDSIDNGLLGDSSEENSTSPTSNSDVDPGLPRSDYLDFEKCLLCKTNEKDISYPYCSNCFTWKKKLFPDRPKKRKRGFKRNVLQSDAISKDHYSSDLQNSKSENNLIEINTKGSPNHSLLDDIDVDSTVTAQSKDAVDGSSQTSASNSSPASASTSNSPLKLNKNFEACSVCFLKPENGLFVHLSTAHRYGCYSCAKEIWYQNGGCPLCRRKVFKVTKLYL